MKPGIKLFFDLARERHQIFQFKEAGNPRPWTADPIFSQYRFTNPFRENDKTTAWFRKFVRSPMKKSDDVLMATVAFRLLNRIATGEAMFNQKDVEADSAFDLFLQKGDARHLLRAIKSSVGPNGPYVTGAYIISSPPGFSKLEGMMEVIGGFYKNSGWREWLAENPKKGRTMEGMWNWLSDQPWLGKFHSYEIVCDLRYTDILGSAPDRMTWASPGPGCRRGLNRAMGRDVKDHRLSREELIEELRYILECSQNPAMWPKQLPAWEMRECEHWSCEYDKYLRVKNGEGRPRGVYR
jgi:hypothetical protein